MSDWDNGFAAAQRAYDMQSDDRLDEDEWIEEYEEQPNQNEIDEVFRLWEEELRK